MSDNIITMGDHFNVTEARKTLIAELKKRGFNQDKVDELIKMCDEAYENFKIPYPTIDEILKDAK